MSVHVLAGGDLAVICDSRILDIGAPKDYQRVFES